MQIRTPNLTYEHAIIWKRFRASSLTYWNINNSYIIFTHVSSSQRNLWGFLCFSLFSGGKLPNCTESAKLSEVIWVFSGKLQRLRQHPPVSPVSQQQSDQCRGHNPWLDITSKGLKDRSGFVHHSRAKKTCRRDKNETHMPIYQRCRED